MIPDQDRVLAWVRKQTPVNTVWERALASNDPLLQAHALDAWTQWLMNREEEWEVDREYSAAKGEDEGTGAWLGKEKERVETVVTVTRITGPFPGEYGDSYLCVMETKDTHDLCIWWTGENLGFDEGREYHIRGTVKKLEVFDGKKQTSLSRVKEIK